jgi:mannose-6-phosphate isomerase-like protein (cupin superfamily)
MKANPRRVVTGHTGSGKSVFVSDSPSPRHVAIPGMPAFSITAMWATDHMMTAVPGSEDPTSAMTTFVPGPGGTRLVVTVIPPESQRPAPGRELSAKLPGLAQAMEADHPGMHTTDTVDYDIIMSGTLTLELDDEATVTLEPGDVVIQNGTRHAWRNRGFVPVIMYSVLVGAPRRF